MSVITAAEPTMAGAATQQDYRPRSMPGERPLVHDGTPSLDRSAKPFDDRPRGRNPDQQDNAVDVDDPLPPGAMFAAAVIAGNLPPAPKSLHELYVRIGNSWIPPESELKLRDLEV